MPKDKTQKLELPCRVPSRTNGNPSVRPERLYNLSSQQNFSSWYILRCIVLYISLNYYLNFTNKYLFEFLDFKFPLLIILLGTSINFVCSGVAIMFQKSRPSLQSVVKHWRGIVLIGIAHALTAAFENLSLTRISLSMSQMIKSSGPIFLMLYKFLRNKTSYDITLVGALLIQVLGAALSVYENPNFDLLGIVYASLSLFSAFVITLISENYLQTSVFSPMELNFLSSIPGIVVILFMMEEKELDNLSLLSETSLLTRVLFISTGVVAFFYSLSQFYLLQCTNALYFGIVGNLKTALLVTLAVILLHEKLTDINEFGVVLAIIGFVSYSIQKWRLEVEDA